MLSFNTNDSEIKKMVKEKCKLNRPNYVHTGETYPGNR